MSLILVFGWRGADADGVVRMLRGHVSEEEITVMRQVRDQVRSGRRVPDLDPDLVHRAEEILGEALRRRGELNVSVDDVLSANGKGFLDPLLDRAYRRDLRRSGRAAEDMPPRTWVAEAQRRGDTAVAQLLSLHLGRNLGQTAPTRYRHLGSIPCPDTAGPERLRRLKQQLENDVDLLGDRLDNMITEIRQAPPQLRTTAQLRVKEGHLRILSGNIGEIMARPRMLNILAARQAVHPDAVLITGARYRTTTGRGPALLFIDALVVRFVDGRLIWLDRVEVKNMRNADAGVDQHIATGELQMGSGDFTGSVDDAVMAADGPDAVVLDPQHIRVWRDPDAAWVRLADHGDDLDGEYLIGVSGSGKRATRTQLSKRHVIIPRGFDPLGAGSFEVATEFDNLAGTITVHQAMDATYAELYYLLTTAVTVLKRRHGL